MKFVQRCIPALISRSAVEILFIPAKLNLMDKASLERDLVERVERETFMMYVDIKKCIFRLLFKDLKQCDEVRLG